MLQRQLIARRSRAIFVGARMAAASSKEATVSWPWPIIIGVKSKSSLQSQRVLADWWCFIADCNPSFWSLWCSRFRFWDYINSKLPDLEGLRNLVWFCACTCKGELISPTLKALGVPAMLDPYWNWQEFLNGSKKASSKPAKRHCRTNNLPPFWFAGENKELRWLKWLSTFESWDNYFDLHGSA